AGSVTEPSITSMPVGRFSRRPVERSSSTRTGRPTATSASTKCEPMNPAPPVTRQRAAMHVPRLPSEPATSRAAAAGRSAGCRRGLVWAPPWGGAYPAAPLERPRGPVGLLPRPGPPPWAPAEVLREPPPQPADVVHLLAGQPQARGALARLELQRQHTHAHQV